MSALDLGGIFKVDDPVLRRGGDDLGDHRIGERRFARALPLHITMFKRVAIASLMVVACASVMIPWRK